LLLPFTCWKAYDHWQLQQPFIQQAEVEYGEIGFNDNPEEEFTSSSYYPHTLEAPFLIVDFSCQPSMFNFWNHRPQVKSMDGYSPVFSDFETPDQPFSFAYQDMYFDSLQLTFHSLFGDSVTVVERNISKGKICVNPRKLDRLAGYERGRIPTKYGANKEIYISYESIGCFGGREKSLRWSAKSPSQLEYGEFYDTDIVLLATQNNFQQKAIEAIHLAQQTELSLGDFNTTIVHIKVGAYVLQLNDMTNDLSSIRALFASVEEGL